MAVLLIAEHDNASLKDATHKALTAAAQMGGDVHVLVAGNKADAVAAQAARLAGVKKVLHAETASLERPLAEPGPIVARPAEPVDERREEERRVGAEARDHDIRRHPQRLQEIERSRRGRGLPVPVFAHGGAGRGGHDAGHGGDVEGVEPPVA